MTSPSFNVFMKAGPLRNGAERGHGSVWHCVEGEAYQARPALCGDSPSISWSSWSPAGQRVTCERCLKLIGMLQAADSRGVIGNQAKGFAGRAFTFNAAKLLRQKLIEPSPHGDYYITERGSAVAQMEGQLA
jgi:hypothetical protein